MPENQLQLIKRSALYHQVEFWYKTDCLLGKLPDQENRRLLYAFIIYSASLSRTWKDIWIHIQLTCNTSSQTFDPRKLPIIIHNIADYSDITALATPSPQLMEEGTSYTQFPLNSLPNPLILAAFWENLQDPSLLSTIAWNAIWMPVVSVDVERSFS